MSLRTEPTLPFHFGAGDALFGLYHAVAGAAGVGVLLCPPLGQEMIRSHRIYRQLGDALAQHGAAAMRFDYYGSGDSAGASLELDWARCIDDTVAAATELRARTGCRRVIGFGARLGGGIALAAARAADLAELILWDPVLDGADYMARLDAMQEALRVDPMRFNKPRPAPDAAGQWLGFPVSPQLRRQLGEWRGEVPGIPTTWLDSQTNPAAAQQARWADGGVTIVTLPSPTSWEVLDRLEHAILSPELVRAVAGLVRVPA